MPFNSKKSLLSNGIQYDIIRSFKQNSEKQVCKALRIDPHTGLKQEVCLKIFSNHKKNYKEEFESLSKIRSVYCIQAFGFESFGTKSALVLEYIKGISLYKLIEHFSLNEQETQHILISIYKGLQDLNKQGLCHGDLSLDNVLIDRHAHIKLIDFGKANYEHITQGTPPFTAPEILKGYKATFLSDLYALGIIEEVLRTPHPLYTLENIKEIKIKSKNPLLTLDPINRYFPHHYKKNIKQQQNLKLKVKDILSFMSFKQKETIKTPTTRIILPFIKIKQFLYIFLISLITGIATHSHSLHQQGILKIYTHNWYRIHIKGFKSYTPLIIPLKTGWHSITWENKTVKGHLQVFIPKGQSVFLSDENFMHSSTKKRKKQSI